MKQEIIKLAAAAGFDTSKGTPIVRHSNGSWVGVEQELEAFARLIMEAEQERQKNRESMLEVN